MATHRRGSKAAMTFTLPKYTWDKDRELCKQCKHYEERPDNPKQDAGGMVMLCHAYLRGAEINDQTGSRTIGRDELARQINLYLNGQTQEHLPEGHQSLD